MATTRGPYIQMVGPSQATIQWRTYYEVEGMIKFGTTPDELTQQLNNAKGFEHSVTIQNLKPSTKYYYSVWSGNHKSAGDSNYYFITSPPIGTIKKSRVWVIGDAGTNNYGQNQVRNALESYNNSEKPNLWIWLGDNAYNAGTDKEYQEKVFSNHYENQMKNICVWSTIGNHDFANEGYQSYGAQKGNFPYYNIFTLPTNGEAGGTPSGKENYYSFDYGMIHFICLDSYSSLNEPGSEMYQWLEKDLQSTNQKWKVVFFHHPPYAKGTHNSDTEQEMIDMRTNIVPLLEKYGTDLVLGGHSHSYERSYLLKGHYGKESSLTPSMILNNGSGKDPNPYIKNAPDYAGTVYAVIGNSGKAGGFSSGYPHDAMYYSTKSELGAMILDIEENKLTGKFINADGKVLDEFSIQKF